MVEIDLDKLDNKPERINISIPRFVLNKIDKYAESRHETRSGLLSRAARRLIDAAAKWRSGETRPVGAMPSNPPTL